MKKEILRIIASVFAGVLISAGGNAQTITLSGSVITQPCNNNGSIGVSAVGLTPPINYKYDNYYANVTIHHNGVNSTSDILSNIPAYCSAYSASPFDNTWFVTATDANTSVSTSVTLVPPFTYSVTQTPANCPAQNTVSASMTGGSPPYTLQWTNVNTSNSYNNNPTALPNGSYSLVVTDNAGCTVETKKDSVLYYVMSNSGITGSISTTPANCTNGTAIMNVSGGVLPYTYQWHNNATTASLINLTGGPVNCVVTDAQGCQNSFYGFIQQSVFINLNPVITPATCTQSNGAIQLFPTGGTGPYTYLWSTSANTQNISNLNGGSYGVVVTDANGCTANNNIFVSASSPVQVTYMSQASSCTSPTGGATLSISGGSAPYSVIWNTFPNNTTGTSISGMPAGAYSFKVTDNNGCVRTGFVNIPSASTLSAGITSAPVYCPATSGSMAAVAVGNSPPFSYQWSNSSTSATITSAPMGVYTCTITDAAGCKVVKTLNLQQTSPISLGMASSNVSCKFSTDGSATVTAFGGNAPYTYQWSNSQTGSTATSLGMNTYYVTATDASGCTKTGKVIIGNSATTNSCYCTITGKVYVDANNNCVMDSGENGVPNVQIHCSSMGYAYTDGTGQYSFQVPTGNYTISETILQTYPLASCQSNNQPVNAVAASNCVQTVNFANNVLPVSDLRIVTFNQWIPPILGNTYSQKVSVYNDGTVTESLANLGYWHDGQLSFNSCTPWSLSQQNATSHPNWYSITSGFPTLSPGANTSAIMSYNVPTNIPLNTKLLFRDTIAKTSPIGTNWLTDNSPWNNLNYFEPSVVASFDPNYKEVSPSGVGAAGNILHKDSILTYVIHFQNEGSWFAQNVVITDSIDVDLNIHSLRPGESSHQYTLTIDDNRVARFTFSNINLPYKSFYGDALSSGHVSYSIRLNKNLPVGSTIRNNAAIFFDFNEPVITNTTLNTLVLPVGMEEQLQKKTAGSLVYPNPAGNTFSIVFHAGDNEKGVLAVYDISGRKMRSATIDITAGMNHLDQDCSDMQQGIYIVEVVTSHQKLTNRLVITR